MSRRLLIIAAAAIAATAGACSSLPTAEVDFGSGFEFVPYVVDATDNVGLGAAATVDADGLPYVSYFGFPAEVAEGEIAPTRPVGFPFLPAVQLAHLTSDGYWNRGAVAESKDQPAGVTTPFGPETLPPLKRLTPQAANGTSVAVDAAGTTHVAWTGNDGVWYASATDSSTTEQVFDYGSTVARAGPIGRPTVAADAEGNPWISFGVTTAKGLEVRVATKSGDTWRTETIATIHRCDGCEPGPAPIGLLGDTPTVAFADADAGVVRVWQPAGKDGWAEAVTAIPARGAAGLSMGVADDVGYLSYYTGDKVEVASITGGRVVQSDVADADLGPTPASGASAATTGVGAGGGTVYVAWQDTKGVYLASSADGETFEPVETGTETIGGELPSLAVAADGSSSYFAWYDVETMNLNVGVLAETSGVAIAAPSPTLEVVPGGTSTADCGKDGQVQLSIVAKDTAFDPTCLVAEAGNPFTVVFSNEDASLTHNLDIMDVAKTEGLPGVLENQKLKVDALDPGDYPFVCDYHPNMTGVLAVIKVK